jgi:hypothetical protein
MVSKIRFKIDTDHSETYYVLTNRAVCQLIAGASSLMMRASAIDTTRLSNVARVMTSLWPHLIL